MNVIFITLSNINNIKEKGIYADLMRKFRDEGHGVYIVSPVERRMGKRSHIIETDGVKILKVRTLNIQKTNVVEKGIGTLLLERQYINAIKHSFNEVVFDLILYSTPPITFTNVVRYLKDHNPESISYLLLKDIFPQNAVDIGMFGKKSLFYWYFRKKEKALYMSSDYIGCMSPANVKYLLKHNDYINDNRVEIAPNAIELNGTICKDEDDLAESFYIRKKYGLPTDRPIFIYGGNLGRPQGIDYLIKCLNEVRNRHDCFFVVVGNGTDYKKLQSWLEFVGTTNNDVNMRLLHRLPKEDYDLLVRSCDVGLIFLDHRFTIPNYPSRLLGYLENKMPVICATDVNTDIGRIAVENGYGYWCESVNPEDFVDIVDKMLASDRKAMGEKGYEFLCKNYLVVRTYQTIMKHFDNI